MAVTKSANINWVKDIYIEQEFEVQNDSVFLLTRDYMMSDCFFNKRKSRKGCTANEPPCIKIISLILRNQLLYKDEVNFVDNEVYNKSDEFWDENRFENLNKDERGVYQMLDTLQTVKSSKSIVRLPF
jgi:hypothetical protein